MKIVATIALALTVSIETVGVAAQVVPHPIGDSQRTQIIDYQPDQVVLLQSTLGYHLTVEFSANEQIESVAVGDGQSWQVSTSLSGDHLFLKPLSSGGRTNMTVITANRTYAFDLVSLALPTQSMPYIVRFRYQSRGRNLGASIVAMPDRLIGRYKLRGDDVLRPAEVGDDGVHTYIRWPADTALPATYFQDGNGVETLANGYMRDGLYVLDSVHEQLIFRIDSNVAQAIRIKSEIPR